jgi:hypothetical protein
LEPLTTVAVPARRFATDCATGIAADAAAEARRRVERRWNASPGSRGLILAPLATGPASRLRGLAFYRRRSWRSGGHVEGRGTSPASAVELLAGSPGLIRVAADRATGMGRGAAAWG